MQNNGFIYLLFWGFLIVNPGLSFSQNKVDINILNYTKGSEPEWYTFNGDSAIFKSDTVIFSTTTNCKLVNYTPGIPDSLIRNRCNFIELKFSGKTVTEFFFASICEPPGIFIEMDNTSPGSFKTINYDAKIAPINNDYFITFFRKGKRFAKFKIVELCRKNYGNQDFYDFMKLIRIK